MSHRKCPMCEVFAESTYGIFLLFFHIIAKSSHRTNFEWKWLIHWTLISCKKIILGSILTSENLYFLLHQFIDVTLAMPLQKIQHIIIHAYCHPLLSQAAQQHQQHWLIDSLPIVCAPAAGRSLVTALRSPLAGKHNGCHQCPPSLDDALQWPPLKDKSWVWQNLLYWVIDKWSKNNILYHWYEKLFKHKCFSIL